MSIGLSVQVLGRIRGGRYTADTLQVCSHFEAERISIGSRAGEFPGLVIPDSTVSPTHALITREGQAWVVQDTDSDNGIRALPSVPETGVPLASGRQAGRFEFTDELYCCVGAVVLRLKAV